MVALTIDVPAGDRATTLAAAALEAGYPATAAGVKAMVVDFLRAKYQAQKQVEAQRTVAPTVDTAVTQARTDANTIV